MLVVRLRYSTVVQYKKIYTSAYKGEEERRKGSKEIIYKYYTYTTYVEYIGMCGICAKYYGSKVQNCKHWNRCSHSM